MKPANKLVSYYQSEANGALATDVKYEFEITRSNFIEANADIQLIFRLHEVGNMDPASYSLLQLFSVGSERYNKLIEQFYPLDTYCNFVTAVDVEDFVGCSGVCYLTTDYSGHFLVDMSSIDVDVYARSAIHEMLLEEESPWGCSDGPKHTVDMRENRYAQPNQPEELEAGVKYHFTIDKAHTTNDGVLQVVYKISMLDESDCEYLLLDEYRPDTLRYEKFIRKVYSLPVGLGQVVEIRPCTMWSSFSGVSTLEDAGGKLCLNLDAIEIETSSISRIFHEQIELAKGGEF